MATGGIRYDFTSADALTRFTNRTLRYRTVDQNGVEVVSFAGYEFELFILRSAGDADGLTELRDATRHEVQILDGPITTVAPRILVPLSTVSADWPSRAGAHWHELWRVDAGNVERLSYGEFPVIA